MINEGLISKNTSKKTSLIIQTVGDMFLEHGYSRVSINAIIAKIGGSKRDLYAQFRDKEGLFRCVIADVCQQVLDPLKALPVEGESIEQALKSFGKIFLSVLLSSRVIALQKLVLSEATRYPEFAQTFVELGPVSAYSLAAELLNRRAELGEINVAEPQIMGALFCDMLISDLQFKIISGGTVLDQEIEERVQIAVSIFLNGIKK
ncbi:TetR/AcrR family transcriptional regulator [Acinetobacter radioresistens]|uniref:TetR/AcrR family transcriptional regulator n=1 Tax=Acinetobacter radioresistens TaxID=40216 RepID=UPI0009466770|nr:TetR/AcrR family transcriptional regulator [Acinetobacter radioresistens]